MVSSILIVSQTKKTQGVFPQDSIKNIAFTRSINIKCIPQNSLLCVFQLRINHWVVAGRGPRVGSYLSLRNELSMEIYMLMQLETLFVLLKILDPCLLMSNGNTQTEFGENSSFIFLAKRKHSRLKP